VPIAGAVGRESRRLLLRVVHRPTRAELVDDFVLPATAPGAMIYTDEWCIYQSLPRQGRGHATVCYQRYEWARDDDGDGVREVHDNTLDWIWTGLRNYLPPFREVNKDNLAQYVAMFRRAYNTKAVTTAFLRVLLGRQIRTDPGP
jgi:transposase